MDIEVIKAEPVHLEDCMEALLNSELGRQYFTAQGAESELRRGIAAQEIYIAVDGQGACLGFVWGLEDAAFHVYPYLHIIAVKEAYRGHGIGTRLMAYCENVIFEREKKIFLVVADFNPDAKKLYERLGYVEIAKIPSLYKEGITEHFMMKCK